MGRRGTNPGGMPSATGSFAMFFRGLAEKHWFTVTTHYLLDIALFCGSFLLAMRIRFGAEWSDAPALLWHGLLLGGAAYASAIYIAGFYSPGSIDTSRFRKSFIIALCEVVALFCMLAVFYIDFSSRIGRGVMAIGTPTAYLLGLLHHVVFGFWHPHHRERMALLVGSPEDEAEAVLFRDAPSSILDFVGLITIDDYRTSSDYPVLGKSDHLAELATRERLDRVLCTHTAMTDKSLYATFCYLRYAGVHVEPLITLCEEIHQFVPVELATPEWLLSASSAPHMLYIRKMKRAFDIIVSILGILTLWPIFVLGAAWVKLFSRGPALYRQHRCGRFGKLFEVVKLRTMRLDAEKDGAVWATEKDPRVFFGGNVLRKFRIDEIPQLVNVLRGQMSFVGPRPERPEFVDKLAEEIPFYRERLLIQPGLTGWAQVSFPYGNTIEDARRKLEYDLYYMKHMSVILDLFIILDTVRIVLFGGLGAHHKHATPDYSKAICETRNVSRAATAAALEAPPKPPAGG